MQWDLIKVGRCYVVTRGPEGTAFSGIPFKILAKSPPFLLVEWVDDGAVATLDTRWVGLSTVAARYVREFAKLGSQQKAPPPPACEACGKPHDPNDSQGVRA